MGTGEILKTVLEVVSKPHIRPNSCVANLFKMLTYYRVCCAFSSVCALLLNLIQGFETTSNQFLFIVAQQYYRVEYQKDPKIKILL
jgi:hypothetical protein